MKTKSLKIISFSAVMLMIIAILPIILANTDYSTHWFMPAALLFSISFLTLAAVDFKKLILLQIIILPTVYYFNNYKINIAPYLPFFRDKTILLNPIAVIYLLIIFLGMIVLVENRKMLINLPLKYILLALTLLSLFSTFWSVDVNSSVIATVYLAVPFILYFIAYCYFSNPDDFLKIIYASILSSIIPALVGLRQFIAKDYFYEPDSSLGRIMGTLAHPNSYGLFLFLVISLMAAFYFANKDRKIKNHKLFFTYGAFLLFLLLLTYSRTSWICLLIFLIITIIKSKFLWLTLFVSPLPLGALLLFENIKQRVLEPFNLAIFNSWTARVDIWKVSLFKINEEPLSGYGAGTSELVIGQSKTWDGGTSLPHNDIILHALELGAFGVILFCLYTMAAIVNVYKIYKRALNKYLPVKFFGHEIYINFKIFSFSILAILFALIFASVFESVSQKIFLQTIIWPVLGSLFGMRELLSNKR